MFPGNSEIIAAGGRAASIGVDITDPAIVAAASDLLEKRESLYNNIFIFGDADSVNMTGEACATGRPVYVFEPGPGSPKFARFHAALRRHGATRSLPETPWPTFSGRPYGSNGSCGPSPCIDCQRSRVTPSGWPRSGLAQQTRHLRTTSRDQHRLLDEVLKIT